MHLIFEQYLERYRRLQMTDSATRNLVRTAELFEESGLDPLTATDVEIEEWLAGLRAPVPCGHAPHQGGDEKTAPMQGNRTTQALAPRTVRLHLENLSAVYAYAVRRGVLKANPAELVRLPREVDREPRILKTSELRYMLGNVMTDDQERCLLALMYTGMRRNELRHLQWNDISPTSIRVRTGKGGKLRHVPLHPALAESLIMRADPTAPYVFPARQRSKAGAPLSEASFSRLLEDVRGSVVCSFHDFRRTVASSLYANGVDTLIIDKILGWAPRTVGSRYYIAAAESVTQRAILKLYENDPVTPSRRAAA